MAESNAAEPILKYRDKIANFGKSSEPSKPDASWHNDMVKQANESFKKRVSVPGSEPATKKTPPKKTAQRKKVSSK